MTDPSPPSSRHVYRQTSPQVTGWLFVALAVLLIALALRSWGDHPAPKLVVWLVFGAVLSWTVLLRPSVVLGLDGITIRNIIRDIHLPWNEVDVIEPRWNLRIYTPEDHGYTAWAISSQVARPAHGPGLGLNPLSRATHAATPSSATDGDTGGRSTGPKLSKRVTAATVGDDIRQAQGEIEEAVTNGAMSSPSGAVQRQWYWPSVAALTVSAAAVVLVMLL